MIQHTRLVSRMVRTLVAVSLTVLIAVSVVRSADSGSAATTAVVEDDVFSETHAFDPLLNVVDFKTNLPSLRQRPEEGTHMYWEGEDLVFVGSLVDTEWTRRAPEWPVFHAAALCKAGPNKTCAFQWHVVSPEEAVAKAGPHRLWVRRVQWSQVPAPIVVRVLQGTNVVVRSTLGDNINKDGQYQARVFWDPLDVTLKDGPVTIEIEKPKDETPAGDRIIDAVYLTSNLDYVPVGRTQLPPVDVLKKRAEHIGRGAKMVAWPAEEPWISYGIHDWPGAGEVSTDINLEACQDEYEPALVRLTSMHDAPMTLNIAAGPLKDVTGKTFAPPEVRVAAYMPTGRYSWQPLALMRRRAVGLAPYHTAGLWITVNTHGVPAGDYTSTIALSGDGVDEKINLRLTVHPIRIVWDPEFRTFVLGSPPEAPEGFDAKAAYLRDLAAHGNNCLYHSELALDHADLVKELGFVSGLSRSVDWGFSTTRKDYDSEEYRKVVAEGIAKAKKAADALGFDEKHFSTLLMDEPPLDDHWFNAHRVAKEIDGGVMIWIDPVIVTPEQAKRFLPVIDHWMPHEMNLSRPESIKILKSGKGRVEFYNHFTQDAANPVKSWTWFRRMPWRAWEHQLDGCAFYCYYCPYGNGWIHRPNNVGMYYVVVYPGTAGPIPSPNWEAWREGREDRDRLAVLQEAIDQARKRGDDDAADRAEAAMELAVNQAVNAASPAEYRKANKRVIQAILDLR